MPRLQMRPPASPSCRLALRAGSRRGQGAYARREGGIIRFRPALARRPQFISTEREQKGVGANTDNLHKAGLGQGFGIVEWAKREGQKVGENRCEHL
jgi:hypothetical protein